MERWSLVLLLFGIFSIGFGNQVMAQDATSTPTTMEGGWSNFRIQGDLEAETFECLTLSFSINSDVIPQQLLVMILVGQQHWGFDLARLYPTNSLTPGKYYAVVRLDNMTLRDPVTGQFGETFFQPRGTISDIEVDIWHPGRENMDFAVNYFNNSAPRGCQTILTTFDDIHQLPIGSVSCRVERGTPRDVGGLHLVDFESQFDLKTAWSIVMYVQNGVPVILQGSWDGRFPGISRFRFDDPVENLPGWEDSTAWWVVYQC